MDNRQTESIDKEIDEIKEILNLGCVLCKQEEDFFKFLVTLNSTMLLILIAFSEKIIRIPFHTIWTIIPFIFFSLSLLSSIYTIRILGDFSGSIILFHMALSSMLIRKEYDSKTIESHSKKISKIATKANKSQVPALWLYFLGIGSLIIFAMIKLINK